VHARHFPVKFFTAAIILLLIKVLILSDSSRILAGAFRQPRAAAHAIR